VTSLKTMLRTETFGSLMLNDRKQKSVVLEQLKKIKLVSFSVEPKQHCKKSVTVCLD